MIKGIIGAILGALVVALLLLGFIWLVFSGLILWIAGFILGSLIIAGIILFAIIFVFAVIAFFALFYFLAEKSPKVEAGNYTLKQQKGKGES